MAGWIKMPLGTEVGLSPATLCYMTRTDSQALRTEYCTVGIPHNTVI